MKSAALVLGSFLARCAGSGESPDHCADPASLKSLEGPRLAPL